MQLPFSLPTALFSDFALLAQSVNNIDGKHFIVLLLLALFILLSFSYFAMLQVALKNSRPNQFDNYKGKKSFASALKLCSQPEKFITAAQLGISASSIGLGIILAWLSADIFAKILTPALSNFALANERFSFLLALVLAFSIMVFCHIIIALIAKTIARNHPRDVLIMLGAPLLFFAKICAPLIFLTQKSADLILAKRRQRSHKSAAANEESIEQIHYILHQSEQKEHVTQTEREILTNALELNDLVVRDIMTPRGEVIVLDGEKDFATNLENAISSQHTRFPLTMGHLDHVIGMIHIKDLLALVQQNTAADLSKIKREMFSVPDKMRLDVLLKFFLRHRSHMALVVDEFGGSLGIVTFDNVIEELVGEIQDEFDHSEVEMKFISENEFIVSGSMTIIDLEESTGIVIDDTEVATIGGLVTEKLGHLPKIGENITIADFSVEVTDADTRRVLEVRFRRSSELIQHTAVEKPAS